MTYRARCEGRKTRQRQVRRARDRRAYEAWRRVVEPLDAAPVPIDLDAAARHMATRLNAYIFRPSVCASWRTWEERRRGVPATREFIDASWPKLTFQLAPVVAEEVLVETVRVVADLQEAVALFAKPTEQQ